MDVYWIIVKVNVVILAGLIFCHRLSIWFSSTDTSNHILLERMRQDFSFYSRIAMRSFLKIFQGSMLCVAVVKTSENKSRG